MTDQRKNKLKRRLQESRYRLLCIDEGFALPLKKMTFVAVDDVYRISTDGENIFFDANWLSKLSNPSIDFMLSHQLMHIHMKHIKRPEYFRGDRFHLACDIVANAHLGDFCWYYEKLPSVGAIYRRTFFPAVDGRELTAQEAIRGIPFDPAVMKPSERRRYMIDSEEYWDGHQGRDDGTVVLSAVDDDPDDLRFEYTLGGVPYNAVEEEYFPIADADNSINTIEEESPMDMGISWDKISSDSVEALRYIKSRSNKEGIGNGRLWYKTDITKLDWRNMLNSFVQDEVYDYSFLPPDRRYSESDFFLPDFNVCSEKPLELVFAVDTSASVSDKMLSAVLSELRYALSLLDGQIAGRLFFFDTRVYPSVNISSVDDIDCVIPVGGGATDLGCIFDHLSRSENPPEGIIICTDGLAEFPKESRANGIPVLWLITSLTAVPPWGKASRLRA